MARAGLIGAIVLQAACAGSERADTEPDGRLNGEWEIALTSLQATTARGGERDTNTTRGSLAFVPNRAGARVPGFEGIPQQVGTHNLRLDRLVPELTSHTTEPMVAGSSAGDSVRMVVDPGSGEPLVLRGTWEGSGVTGTWMAHRRAGIDQSGRFSLSRPSP